MMRKNRHFTRSSTGASRLGAGVSSPQVALLLLSGGLLTLACGSKEQDRNLQPSEVGMTLDVAPIFDNGETKLFEVKKGLQFPIVQPDKDSLSALKKNAVQPYGRQPWVTTSDSKVQLTWTITNLDDDGHNVELIIDPWNEFGRYYPGMQLANASEQKFEPNKSGIDHYYVLDGKGAGESSRRHGTYTFDDMNELAIDFATVQNLIKVKPPLPAGYQSNNDGMDDPLPIYANHAFSFENRSPNDLLIRPYIPAVIAGLTGIDFGLRTGEPATVALEISIEIVDLGNNRVQEEGSSEVLLKPTTTVVTVGSTVPPAM